MLVGNKCGSVGGINGNGEQGEIAKVSNYFSVEVILRHLEVAGRGIVTP